MSFVFDIDGTIADASHRLHYIHGEHKDWAAFFDAMSDDSPIVQTLIVLRIILSRAVTTVHLVTGRPDSHRKQTEAWLGRQFISVGERVSLHMRKTGDYRPDHVIKKEWFDSLSKAQQGQIVMVFEDRGQVVKMWRDCGLIVAQVAEGDF